MKALLFCLFVITVYIFPQTQKHLIPNNPAIKVDTVNIKQIVMKEIEKIRSKERVKIIQYEKKLEQSAAEKNVNADFSSNIIQKLFLLADVSVGAALVILFRRRKIKINAEANAKLKKNVLKLRNDKVDSRNDLSLSTLRISLQSRATGRRFDDETLIKQARQLSVSKGELFLASRLTSFKRLKNAQSDN